MTNNSAGGGARSPRLRVGDRVIVSRTGDAPIGRGTLIEDYARYRVGSRAQPTSSPPVRRWAVSLDTGHLTFADDHEVSVDVDTGPLPIAGHGSARAESGSDGTVRTFDDPRNS